MFDSFLALSSLSWEGLGDWTGILLVVLFLLAGLLFGYALRGLVGRWQAEAIEKKMRLREAESEAEVKARLKEADIAARAAVVKAREEFEASTKSRRAELQATEDRLTVRESNLDKKATLLDNREAAVNAKSDAAAVAAEAAKAAAAKAADAQAIADARFQKLAGLTREEARKDILAKATEELRADAATLSRRIQEAAREDGEAKARRLLADAVQRCAVSHAVEMMTTTVPLPGDEVKGRIIGRDGRNIRALEAATGVTLLVDDTPEAIVLSSFDPVRRAVARRALELLVADGRIHPGRIEEAVEDAKTQVEAAAAEAGAAAAAEAHVSGLSAEVLRTMGRLRFRTSFSQNVLRHSVEVALLMGEMAEEMGLDPARARRIGFLHDIGKALDAEKKGPHAALGADYLKVQGEDAENVLAVAAHHPEAHIDGGVYGVLCAAADAISSSRPGARQETTEIYVERLEKLEALVMAHPGVVKTFAVQAGRDVRVIVDPGKVSDADAELLARDVCREISAQLKFPGQIRVTVIRELRCTEYAK